MGGLCEKRPPSPHLGRSPHAGGRDAVGSRFAQPNAEPLRFPAPRRPGAMFVPPSGSRAVSPRRGVARGRAGSSVVAPLRLPDGQAGTSIPARGPLRAASPCLRHLPSASLRHIEGACQEVSPKFVQRDSPSGAVRGLAAVAPPPFLFLASRLMRTSSELGRDAATCVAKTGAAVKVGNSFRLNSAAPVFRLAAGVSPSNQETDKPAHPKPVRRRASRLGRPTLRFGYSRANRDSEGHLQGRPARSARIVPHPA